MIIKCPHCKNEFPLADDVLASDEIAIKLKSELQEEFDADKKIMRQQMEEYKAKKEAEMQIWEQQKLAEINAKEQQKEIEIANREKLIRENLEATMGSELEFLKEQNKAQKDRLKEVQEKDLEILRMKQLLEDQTSNAELEINKKLIEKEIELKKRLSEEATLQAEEKAQLKIKELESKLQDQKKLNEESQRKLNQGSMELQGEVQEDFIKNHLVRLFPFDEIIDVKKGQRGGDLIQYVKNNAGETCGIILYESKNAKAWSNDWVTKLNADKRELNADIGVIISQVFPKNIKNIGQEQGLWICGLKEFDGVAAMLRDGIIQVYTAKRSQENKGDKMVMLYDYLNSNDFKQRWDGILDGFRRMKKSIEDQRNYAIKQFAEQDAIINNILLNGNTFLGSIKGISGSGLDEVRMLE